MHRLATALLLVAQATACFDVEEVPPNVPDAWVTLYTDGNLCFGIPECVDQPHDPLAYPLAQVEGFDYEEAVYTAIYFGEKDVIGFTHQVTGARLAGPDDPITLYMIGQVLARIENDDTGDRMDLTWYGPDIVELDVFDAAGTEVADAVIELEGSRYTVLAAVPEGLEPTAGPSLSPNDPHADAEKQAVAACLVLASDEVDKQSACGGGSGSAPVGGDPAANAENLLAPLLGWWDNYGATYTGLLAFIRDLIAGGASGATLAQAFGAVADRLGLSITGLMTALNMLSAEIPDFLRNVETANNSCGTLDFSTNDNPCGIRMGDFYTR